MAPFLMLVTTFLIAPASAQDTDAPSGWLGTWKLDLQRSSLDERAPQIESQVLRIEVAEDVLLLTAETTLPSGQLVSDVARVNMTGEPVQGPAGAAVTFRRVDERTFDIILQSAEAVGTNWFEFSATGRLLTQTKTQTFKAASVGVASTAEPVVSVLVFERQE